MGLWLATATLTGAVIMGLELAAFRLYAPYFGYSIYVWGSMISVVMAALAGGYALGGWLADRSQTDTPLYVAVLASGIYQLAIVFTARPLLRWLWQSGEFTGPVVATLIIFAPPMIALAATSPFVIRLLARVGHVGSTAGKIYALSTVGSIAGILATSFFLVPRLGTQTALETLCAVSVVIGVVGLFARWPAALVALVPIAALPFLPEAKLAEAEVWRTESAYNLVRVVRRGNLLLLVLNDARFFQTIREVESGWSGTYQDEFALGPLLVPARRLLVLGMGAGGSIASTRAVAPDIEVDAVEIDEKVVEAGVRFFGLRPGERGLRVHVADARPWLAQDRDTYPIVHVDLYQGGPYVPFYLITVEFFRLVRARMSEDGALMMNVYDLSPRRELLNATGATLHRVFPSVAVLPRADGSHIVFAFPRERSGASIQAELRRFRGPERVEQVARRAASAIVDLVPPPATPIFTDDRAPVEEMTRHMLMARRSSN